MSARRVIISSLLVATLLGLVYYLHDKFERVSEEVDIGFKGEARSNSLYASRLFLKAMGIPAEAVEFYQIDRLPSLDTVIVINTHRTTLSTQRIDKLLAWVQQGGHLLTIIAPDYVQQEGYDDVLQRRLNITTNHAGYFSVDDEKDNAEKDKQQEQETVTVRLTGLSKPYELAINRFHPVYSNNNQEEQVKIGQTNFLINRSYGDGMVSLIADLEFAENDAIDEYDHAEFFWQLIHRQHKAPRNVWLLNNDDMPALWKWLWQYASAFIISATLLVLFWFYKLAQRFGPLIPHRSLDRRRILEHIQASGYFLWRHDQQQLIQSSRQSVQQKFEILFPAWNQLSQDEQLDYASEHSQLSIDVLRHLLYEQKKWSVDEFIDLVQQLEKLRKT